MDDENKRSKLGVALLVVFASAIVFVEIFIPMCTAQNDLMEYWIAPVMEEFKNADGDIVGAIAAVYDEETSESAEALEVMGLKGEDVARALLSGFDYEADDFIMGERACSMHLKVWSHNFNDFAVALDEVNAEMEGLTEQLAFDSEEEFLAYIGKRVLDAFVATPLHQTGMAFICVDYGDGWEVSDVTMDQLVGVLFDDPEGDGE